MMVAGQNKAACHQTLAMNKIKGPTVRGVHCVAIPVDKITREHKFDTTESLITRFILKKKKIGQPAVIQRPRQQMYDSRLLILVIDANWRRSSFGHLPSWIRPIVTWHRHRGARRPLKGQVFLSTVQQRSWKWWSVPLGRISFGSGWQWLVSVPRASVVVISTGELLALTSRRKNNDYQTEQSYKSVAQSIR